MVRQLTSKTTPGGKALLAIIVVTGGLLWHLLACKESPMAFSPSGKDLAFVTMDPHDPNDMIFKGTHVYRLMVLTEGRQLRVIEETTEHILSGPAYSPDGKHLCYLRLPLLEPEELDELKAYRESKAQQKTDGSRQQNQETAPWPGEPASKPSTEDLVLPPMGATAQLVELAATGLRMPTTLIVRNTQTHAVESETLVDICLSPESAGGNTNTKPGEDLWTTYLMVRPQYSPDGQWVYFCAGHLVMSVNPGENKVRTLAGPALLARLSPDGKTIATVQEGAIGFIQTDGSKAVYLRADFKELSIGGLAWMDNRTLMILSEKDNKQLALLRIQVDGSASGETVLPRPEKAKSGEQDLVQCEWTVSEDGRYIVLAPEKNLVFMRKDGTVLKRYETDENTVYTQPSFTPDSQRVAVKYLTNEKGSYPRVAAIVFFTPEGKEVSRVGIPPIKPGSTRPVERPEEEADHTTQSTQ